ncbi:MAG TPA: hypothetical protein GXX65_01110 [Methanosarcina sp.]|nr:hypothetical protein [Methanosarcina sp.]
MYVCGSRDSGIIYCPEEKKNEVNLSRLRKSQGNYLKRFYWGEKTLWSYGYFASTIGNVSKETAAAYIRNQG